MTVIDEFGANAFEFGLSAAEIRVVSCILQGKSMRQAARELGVEYNTVRKQLQMIFLKTNTHRQSALVVLFLTPRCRPTRRTLTQGNTH